MQVILIATWQYELRFCSIDVHFGRGGRIGEFGLDAVVNGIVGLPSVENRLWGLDVFCLLELVQIDLRENSLLLFLSDGYHLWRMLRILFLKLFIVILILGLLLINILKILFLDYIWSLMAHARKQRGIVGIFSFGPIPLLYWLQYNIVIDKAFSVVRFFNQSLGLVLLLHINCCRVSTLIL